MTFIGGGMACNSPRVSNIGGELDFSALWSKQGGKPLVIWNHDDERIHAVVGNVNPEQQQVITIRSQRYGEQRVKEKSYNILKVVSEATQQYKCVRTGLWGPLAAIGIRGKLSRELSDWMNFSQKELFTVEIDEAQGVINGFGNLGALTLLKGINKDSDPVKVVVKFHYNQRDENAYHIYEVTPVVTKDKMVAFHFDDVRTHKDEWQELTRQTRPVIDRLELYAKYRFLANEIQSDDLPEIIWDSTRGVVGISISDEWKAGRKIFPICIKDQNSGDKHIRVVQVSVTGDEHSPNKIKCEVKDLTNYIKDRDVNEKIAISELTLEEALADYYTEKFNR
ncbi:MAG: hypothetical protein ACPGUD_06040 [Parashewanella sp.]